MQINGVKGKYVLAGPALKINAETRTNPVIDKNIIIQTRKGLIESPSIITKSNFQSLNAVSVCAAKLKNAYALLMELPNP